MVGMNASRRSRVNMDPVVSVVLQDTKNIFGHNLMKNVTGCSYRLMRKHL